MSGSDLVDRSRTYSVPLIYSVVSATVEYLYCRPTAASHATGSLESPSEGPMAMSAGRRHHRRGTRGPVHWPIGIGSHFEVDTVGRRGTVTCVRGTVQLMALSRLDLLKGRVSVGFDLSNPTPQRTTALHGKVINGTPLSESRNRWRLTLADWVSNQAKWQW